MITEGRLVHFETYYLSRPGEKATAILELVSAVRDLRSTILNDQDQIRHLTTALELNHRVSPQETVQPVSNPLLPDAASIDLDVDKMRDRFIRQAHQMFDGNREQMSKALGIAVRTLSERLRKLGYPPRSKACDEPVDFSDQREASDANSDRKNG